MSLTDIPHYGAETQTHTNITFNGDYATQQCTICSLATTWQKGKLHGEKPLISNSGKDLLKISKRVLNRNSVHQGQLQYFSRQTH